MLGMLGLLGRGGCGGGQGPGKDGALAHAREQLALLFPDLHPDLAHLHLLRPVSGGSPQWVPLQHWRNRWSSPGQRAAAQRAVQELVQRAATKVVEVFGADYPRAPPVRGIPMQPPRQQVEGERHPRKPMGRVDEAAEVEELARRNEQLQQLHALFPQLPPAFLRQEILAKAPIPHIQLLVDAILGLPHPLKSPVANAAMAQADLAGTAPLPPHECFRTRGYCHGAYLHLCNVFPRLRSSTIQAVLREVNHHLPTAHDRLAGMEGSIWHRTLVLFAPARPPREHPDLEDPELLHDLQLLQHQEREGQVQADAEVARALNAQEYARAHALIECACCYEEVVFEELGHCASGEHLFCLPCIRRHALEGLWGTGALRGRPIPCMSSEGAHPCPHPMPEGVVARALTPEEHARYTCTLVKAAAGQAGVALVQCPFCSYAVEAPEPAPCTWRDVLLSVQLGVLPLALALLEAVLWLVCLDPWLLLQWSAVHAWLERARLTARRRQQARARAATIFTCRNPRCGRPSCIACREPFEAPHTCFQRDTDSLRLFVEQRLAMHVVRVCPHCRIQFTKADGCNKMQCPQCRYSMCFLCREDITTERYAHFCPHFRILPGTPCTVCTRCNLYEEGKALSLVKEEAIAEWRRRHPGVRTSDTLCL